MNIILSPLPNVRSKYTTQTFPPVSCSKFRLGNARRSKIAYACYVHAIFLSHVRLFFPQSFRHESCIVVPRITPHLASIVDTSRSAYISSQEYILGLRKTFSFDSYNNVRNFSVSSFLSSKSKRDWLVKVVFINVDQLSKRSLIDSPINNVSF